MWRFSHKFDLLTQLRHLWEFVKPLEGNEGQVKQNVVEVVTVNGRAI